MKDTTTPGIGHNRGPEALADEFSPAIQAFVAGIARWTATPIETEEDAQDLRDFLAGGSRLFKEVDAARREAKRPHDEAAKAVQAAFAKPLDLLDRTVRQARGLLEAYLAREQERLDVERAERIAEAERQVEEAAARYRAAAASGHVLEAHDAQNALDEAEAALKALRPVSRARIESATGGARALVLRRRRDVRITNITRAFVEVRDDPAVVAAVEDALRRRVRAAGWDGRPIPGCEIIEKGAL